MRKYFMALFAVHLFVIVAFTQDIKQISEDFAKGMNDPKAFPYGHNKDAGKYYDIRGFKM